MNAEEKALLAQYEAEIASAQAQQQPQQYSTAMYPSSGKQNLIEWELDFKPELDEIKMLLRCDVLARDGNGNEGWIPNPNKSQVFLNDLGVSDFVRNMITIVNKNKALANYNTLEINDRVRQIKHELRTLVYNNYEAYGIDNEYKMNNYSMIILSVGSVVEDVYRRAMNGATHTGLNEQRVVSQTDQVAPQMNYPMMVGGGGQNKPHGIAKLMPWNWKR